jgi:CubicO group peptidase (beta-lactamase class C family)
VIFEPGERFFYNNAAWRILGAVVQQVSGMPFHAYVTEHVIRPLGMRRTTSDTRRLFADADHLVPHRQGDGAPEATPFPYPNPEDNPEFSFLSAAGGISSSATEMTRYLNALIEMGAYPGGRLLSRQAMQAMQSLQVSRGDGYYGEYGYGYGLTIVPGFLGEKMVEHGGSIRVSTATMAFVPEHRIGVVMLGNSGGMDYATVAEAVLAILMDQDPDDVVPVLVIRERMRQLTGEYAIYRDLETLEIVEKRGMLYIRRDDSLAPLIPASEDYRNGEFYLLREGTKTPVEVSFGNDGAITMLLDRYAYRKTR